MQILKKTSVCDSIRELLRCTMKDLPKKATKRHVDGCSPRKNGRLQSNVLRCIFGETMESALSVTHTNAERLLQYSVLIELVPQSGFISSHAKNKLQSRAVWLKLRTASLCSAPGYDAYLSQCLF